MQVMTASIPRFKLGQVYMTAGVAAYVKQHGLDLSPYLHRHHNGDWGSVCDDDKQENELSVEQGFRVLSSYTVPVCDVVIWIITEADRSVTTVLFPEEY